MIHEVILVSGRFAARDVRLDLEFMSIVSYAKVFSAGKALTIYCPDFAGPHLGGAVDSTGAICSKQVVYFTKCRRFCRRWGVL